MRNTDEIQGATGSGFVARPPRFKQRSEWYYNLRMSIRLQRLSGHGRHGPGRGNEAPTADEGSLEGQDGRAVISEASPSKSPHEHHIRPRPGVALELQGDYQRNS